MPISKRSSIISLLFIAAILTALSQENQPKAGYQLVNPQKVESKNYYLFSVINESELMKNIFSDNATLRRIAVEKYNRLLQSEDSYNSIAEALKFTSEEIGAVANELSQLYESEKVLEDIYRDHVIASGCYYLLTDKSGDPAEIIGKIWEQDAHAMNKLIDVYGKGEEPFYPNIDSISYAVGSRKHNMLMTAARSLILLEAENNPLFYFIPYYAGKLMLDINDRDDSVVYEPLGENENKASYERITTIDWDAYPYSVIVILGWGPDNYDFPLNPGAKIRIRTAVTKFKEGVAPFIIVTGGKVYPYKTRNVEAYHMKRYLMQEFNIPEDHIIIEPHARHTTSNIRNSARIIYRTGIPIDKPMLVSSSEQHVSTVASDAFVQRCQKELNLVPYTLGKRTGPNFVELYPLPNALQINPIEPIDP